MSEENKTKTCFVIMPISDQPKYPTGHFDKIYEQIIVPACIAIIAIRLWISGVMRIFKLPL